MKKILMSMIIGSIVFSGCSSKYPSVKTGATIGGVAGLVTGGLMGAALSKGHPSNGDAVGGAVIGGVVLGLIGLSLGAGTGYIVDISRDNDDEIKEIIHAENIEGLER